MKKLILILFICSLCYADSGRILDDAGDAYYISTSYDGNDLRTIQYTQINDVMYMVAPNYPPQKLERLDHDHWDINDVNWLNGPFLDENTDSDITITPSATTGSITLTTTSAIFDGNHVGALWQISSYVDSNTIKGQFWSAGDSNSTSLAVQKYREYSLILVKPTFIGQIILQKSYDSGVTWQNVDSWGERGDIIYTGKESIDDAIYRVAARDVELSSHMIRHDEGYCNYTLTAKGYKDNGIVEITAYSDANSVTATVIETLASTDATYRWSEGAWSDYRGWPRAICLYQNRLCLAGTAYQPLTLWCSKSGSYENMEVTGLDDGAIVYDVAAAKQNPILWLADKEAIIAGTSGSMIKISSQSNTKTLTAETIGSQRYNEVGTSNIQAQSVEDSIIYVGRNKKKVYDLIYDIQSDGYVSPELTIFAEDITEPNVQEMAWQERPETRGWFIKNDGNMATLTYNRNQGIAAWTEIATDGNFVSVCCIPGVDEDEVWVAVERDSNDYTLIEKFHPQDWSDDIWFVDSGLEYSGSATATITGLGHLEGAEVQVYSDVNGFVGDFTVSSGSITLDATEIQCIAGLGYTAELKTFPIEVGYEGGTSIGIQKNIREIALCLYKSIGGRYGFEDMWDIPYPSYTDYFTGQIKTDLNSGYDPEIYIIVDQNEPYPLGLTGISLTKFEVYSDN